MDRVIWGESEIMPCAAHFVSYFCFFSIFSLKYNKCNGMSFVSDHQHHLDSYEALSLHFDFDPFCHYLFYLSLSLLSFRAFFNLYKITIHKSEKDNTFIFVLTTDQPFKVTTLPLSQVVLQDGISPQIFGPNKHLESLTNKRIGCRTRKWCLGGSDVLLRIS